VRVLKNFVLEYLPVPREPGASLDVLEYLPVPREPGASLDLDKK